MMNAGQLAEYYEGAHRVIHHANPPPDLAIKPSCFEGLALFERDAIEIAWLCKIYPQTVAAKIDPANVRTKGFRQRLKSRIPEIKKLLDDGRPAWEAAKKLGLSETTIRRVARHLRGEASDEKKSIAVIGTHKITGEVIMFDSMSQAENYGGFQGSKIGLCLTGFASQHRGYTWRRK